ncbi:MAG: TldD/PmbA family protein [Deltaproteobacteria bacterium]|nr:TldD/PmbA family protein [Deltaproteobacteria bacterium]
MSKNHEQDEKTLARIAEFACDRAKKKGAQGASAAVSLKNSFRIMIRDGKQEELTASTGRKLNLSIYVDGRYGSHATSVLGEKDLGTFIDDAVEMTRVLMPDKYRALPDPKYYAGRSQADLHLYDPGRDKLTIADRKERAMKLHDAASRGAGKQVLSVGASVGDSKILWVLRTTNGFSDSQRKTDFWQYGSVTAKDPSGQRPSDWSYDRNRAQIGLGVPKTIGEDAARRTLAQIGTGPIPSTTLPLIIENRAVGRILGRLLSPLYGRQIDQKRSCFDEYLGKSIANKRLTITDDPFFPGGWGSRRFDGEGLTAKKRILIQDGVLKTFYLDNYYATKLAKTPTTGSPSNLVFSLGKHDLDALCRRAGKAILVTGFLGGNSNSTTGDFSHGIAGFLIEGGKRGRPIAAMNIAGNHKTFWKGLVEVGNDPYKTSSKRTPSLLFSPIVIAGK